jgi:NADPH:quinone reductase-like Zn-dependent oxidoreductase
MYGIRILKDINSGYSTIVQRLFSYEMNLDKYHQGEINALKAVLLHEFGEINKLKYEEFPIPEPGEDEVLIKVNAVALNHLDLFIRQGIPGLKLKMPHILGSDISGTVEGGKGIEKTGLYEGQKIVVDPGLSCGVCEFCCSGEISLCHKYAIIGEHKRGGYAEYVTVPVENVVPIPETTKLTMVEAAATPLTFLTAWRMLMTRAQLSLGEDVLIVGIGGGVALAALQIAKLMGSRTFVTSSSNEKLEKARELGADYIINYIENPDYQKDIWRYTNKRGVDVVVDSAGQATFERSLRSLRKGGRFVTCGATTGPLVKLNMNSLFWRQFEILGSTMGTRNELREVLKFVWDRRLKPVVHKILPLSEVQTAHQILEEGVHFGKIVMVP